MTIKTVKAMNLDDFEIDDLDLQDVPPAIDNDVELTLLVAVEQVAEVARHSKLDKSIYETAKRPIAYLEERLKLTPQQVVLYTIFMSMFYDESICLPDIVRFLDILPLKVMGLIEDIEVITARRFIHARTNDGEKRFRVDSDALKAMRKNIDFVKPAPICADEMELFEMLDSKYSMRMRGETTFDELFEEIEEIFEANKSMHFVKSVRRFDNLPPDDIALLVWACTALVTDERQVFGLDIVRNIYNTSSQFQMLRRSLTRSTNELFKLDLLQIAKGDNQRSRDCYELTPNAVNDLLKNLEVSYDISVSPDIIDHKQITAKELFYNPAERESIARLTNLLQPEQFAQVRKSLRDRGFRSGFACLFHGAPGTGKTETVMQLARQSGRDLLQVNIADIKSMWVGESEKNIKKVFARYRKMVKESEVAPILLFNEADAIISKRTENVGRSVDKMENSIQNIILEELENLDGIMIATTNLTCNMDKAFERRFLYKIEFKNPSKEAKCAIWQSMIPELTNEDAMALATKYDFSGGQIENIARKNIVDNILLGATMDLNTLCFHCDAEQLNKKQVSRGIGYIL